MLTILATLALLVTLQVVLVVTLADKLTPDASTARDSDLQAGGRYARYA